MATLSPVQQLACTANTVHVSLCVQGYTTVNSIFQWVCKRLIAHYANRLVLEL